MASAHWPQKSRPLCNLWRGKRAVSKKALLHPQGREPPRAGGRPGEVDRRCCADMALAVAHGLELVLLKPRRLMNLNGLSVASAADIYNLRPEDIYLVHDDLDKALGNVAIKLGGSARGHNGVRSCISALNSNVSGPWWKGLNPAPTSVHGFLSPHSSSCDSLLPPRQAPAPFTLPPFLLPRELLLVWPPWRTWKQLARAALPGLARARNLSTAQKKPLPKSCFLEQALKNTWKTCGAAPSLPSPTLSAVPMPQALGP
uniref:peptidyl-tRNA hydrolase n=1 Tax=Athene cunicularia TaxID=194338 RepID=A0A663NBI3_ATHCN